MEINSGDTAWLLISTALVLMMTPALAFFYGGMVRHKNILSTLNLSMITMGVMSIQWILFGYSLSFGENIAGFIGGFNHLGLAGISAAPGDYASHLPGYLFVAFQMTFAIITPALITGAFVERVRFKSYLIFIIIWGTVVYDPICHWVWGRWAGELPQPGLSARRVPPVPAATLAPVPLALHQHRTRTGPARHRASTGPDAGRISGDDWRSASRAIGRIPACQRAT